MLRTKISESITLFGITIVLTTSAWQMTDRQHVFGQLVLLNKVHSLSYIFHRCTCPTLFRNRIKDGVCSCVCDWRDLTSRRDCLTLAKGKEHFGLRDRVCVSQGDCMTPTCEYGPYDRSSGRCPSRRFKRRYHSRRYQPDKVWCTKKNTKFKIKYS